MAGRWLLANCSLLFLLMTQVDARRSKQRSATMSPTDGKEVELQAPEWAHRMRKRTEVEEIEGKTIVLACPVTGHPKPNIQWLRGGTPLVDKDTGEWQLREGERMRAKNWNLKIIDAQPSQSENYTCVVRNEFGKISWRFNVAITQPEVTPSSPVIVDPPVNQTVVAGRAARIGCRAHTDPTFQHLVEVQWLKHYQVDGKDVDENGQPYSTNIVAHEGKYSFRDEHVLIVERMQVGDSGWYTCLVFLNGYPKIGTHASIYINVRPGRNVHSSGSSSYNTRTARPEVDHDVDSSQISVNSDMVDADRDSKGASEDSERGQSANTDSSTSSGVTLEVWSVTVTVALVQVVHRLSAVSMH